MKAEGEGERVKLSPSGPAASVPEAFFEILTGLHFCWAQKEIE